jgi:NADPH:quinone reductase-like Zn-dependent oxidoreductase
MRTVIQHGFGGPEVLQVVEAPKPGPGPGEVLVRVYAAALNPVDAVVRAGEIKLLGEPPFRVGWDISGVVEAAGAGAGFEVGEEVYGMPGFPAEVGYAEYVAVSADHLARKPSTLSHAEAAAVPLAGLTAWQGLVTLADLQPGQRVLITRAAGGVGHLAVQIAKARGLYVIASASEPKHEFLRSLGADEVLDYRATDYVEAFSDLDAVVDANAEGDRAHRALRPGGVLISLLQGDEPELARWVEEAGYRFAGVIVESDAASLQALAELADAGKLRPHVSARLPLEEVVKAHELLDAGNTVGKIVLALERE